MTNIRIQSISIVDSTTITASFNDALNPDIGIQNVILTSQTSNVPDPTTLKVIVNGSTLTITVQPLTPQAAYYISFVSVPSSPFISLNGEAALFQDSITNRQLILGPTETENPVQQFLFNYLKDNIYNVTDNTTVVNSVIQSLATLLSRALYDIRQTKNENYLSFTVPDEQKVRGSGPFDRLLEESAYEIVRVGRTPTGTVSTLSVPITNFPDFPVSLLAEGVSETIFASSEDAVDTFNINDFIITVSNQNVSKLTGVTFNYSDGYLPYTYNISQFGYQILNSKYDQDFGFSYATLQNNQFKLGETILNDPAFSTQNITNIQVLYEYRNFGRIIDPSSVILTTVLKSTREVLPPIINVFNLQHAPITDTYGNAVTTGGLVFTNSNAVSPSTPHPAFLYELQFNLGAPPFSPGQYSVDYSSGTVYVFGNDITNNGTGPEPPLVTYNYTYTYKNSIDYAYDSDVNDVVALPNGSLINNSGTISFNYEQVLIPGIDYNADLHIEELSERIQNRLLALNVVEAVNGPVTDVFRIFNETSGEVYNILRWSGNKIYYTYNNPPNVAQKLGERASFSDVLNNILFVNQQLTNTGGLTIYKCLLPNNNLISASEDCIGSSINTPITFSNPFIFQTEIWWDGSGIESESVNINRLQSIGQYQVDYVNGIVYVAVTPSQNINIGTISYKANSIIPQNTHILSVDDIYYRVSLALPKNKQFSYASFADGSIIPEDLDSSDEGFLNEFIGAPYEVLGGQIGAFINATFEPGVTNTIKYIRGIFEYNDLQNSTHPLNFASAAVVNGNNITLNPLSNQELTVVLFDGTHHYINVNLNMPHLSSNITFSISVIRNSDKAQLWDGGGQITPGNPVKFVLSGTNSPITGDSVTVTYSITINDLSRVIIDYNKGDLFIDYSYLADEIIISYEYGDNVLDFRTSNSLGRGDTYYATYKVGALRNALLKNFGSLINVPELATFDVNLARERYRDAVTGALESFVIGPTIPAIESLVEAITHITPEIVESIFEIWTLGVNYLNPNPVATTGEFVLIPAKYGNGVTIDNSNQTITLPASSNLKLEQGTFHTWIMPEWDGIDNTVPLTFSITKNGLPVKPTSIFIGAAEYHPMYDGYSFTIDKFANSIGIPNTNKDGVFIYYNYDPSGLFKRWFCEVVDGYDDGYADGYVLPNSQTNTYTLQTKTPGLFYDVKSLTNPKPPSVSITSGTGSTILRITSNLNIHEGITFIADREYYVMDFGEDKTHDRISIYKDPSGYMNFRVYDNKGRSYAIAADVSSWSAHQLHHVAAAWALNTKINRDELHLFIDGFEVPNIIRYGNKLGPYLHENFKTINPEEIAGVVTRNIVGSFDLVTTQGSNQVTSSLNFSVYGIVNGNVIFINESGFNPSGYTINNVNGNTLTLSTTMPLSITDGSFSVNQVTIPVVTELSIFPNIAVSTISTIHTANDLVTIANSDVVSSVSTNFTTLGITAGYLLRVDGYQFESHYVILSVSGNSVVLNDTMPINGSGLTFHLYINDPVEIPGVRALHPSYSLSEDALGNDSITIYNAVKANDLILINTLGLNHKRVRETFYQWGSTNNIIKTRIAPPINLNAVKISHILLSSLIINSGNSNVVVNSFTSNNIVIDQPSISDNGRTLAITVSSGNIDFTTPLNVIIDGYNSVGSPQTETVSFSNVGVLNTINKYSQNNTFKTSIAVNGHVINASKTFLTIQVQEALPITQPENSNTYPVIRYSYQVAAGATLQSSGTTIVSDVNTFFSSLDVGGYLVVTSPAPAIGSYPILAVSSDHHSITLATALPAFSDGYYQVLNSTAYRSGLQNGYFTFEMANQPGVPYIINQGSYIFDFYTYLHLPFSPISGNVFFGSDINGDSQLNGTMDEVKISTLKLTDTRVGEIVTNLEETITKNFNSLKALKQDPNTLVLLHFDTFPFINDASYYISANKQFRQSSSSVNDNFAQSICITNKPIIIENNGILNSQDQGTIEFWINPIFDTANDPNYRYYFDAAGIEIENVTSIDDVTVQTIGRIGQVLSVTLQSSDGKLDYFAGGRVELSTTGAITENAISINSNMVIVSKTILQIITVKIVGDPTNHDYFAGGNIGTDGRTIYLGTSLPESTLSLIVTYKPVDNSGGILNSQVIRLNRRLPNQNTPVTVTYVPSGLEGDRISIFKDPAGFINFNVTAAGNDYLVRGPSYWAAGTWHRIKATYTVNAGRNNSGIRLFIDGYEQGNILFGEGLLFGEPYNFGSTFTGLGGGTKTNIPFKDFLGELYIGGDFTGQFGAYALIDNFRISNLARPVYAPYGESIDVNWNSNTSVAFPVTQDLYTTLLMDFDTLITKNNNFITLIDKTSGIFDFTINIIDSFGIVSSSVEVKSLLETLINILKPANSRVALNYIS